MDYYVDSLAYEACEIKLYQELEHYELKSTCIRQKKQQIFQPIFQWKALQINETYQKNTYHP